MKIISSPRICRIPFKVLILAFFCITSVCLRAEESKSYSGIGFLNRYPVVEPAFSRGSYGASFGLSTAFQSIKDLSEFERYHLYSDPDGEDTYESKVQSKAISFIKGTDYPIDFGLYLRQLNIQRATSAGAHIQANLFERFKMPSFSLRLATQKIFGLYALETRSYEAQLLSSYAVLSNVIVTLGLSWSKHQFSADYSRNTGDYQLQSDLNGEKQDVSSQISVASISTKLVILSPNLCISGELAGLINRLNTYSTQIILQLEI